MRSRELIPLEAAAARRPLRNRRLRQRVGWRQTLARHAFTLDAELEKQRFVLLGELLDHFAAARPSTHADFTRRLPLVRRHCSQQRNWVINKYRHDIYVAHSKSNRIR